MMATDDGLSDVVDWGDGEDDELPQGPADSQAGGLDADADAISLASDGDDLEALKKYHNQTWNDPLLPHESSVPSSVPEPPVSQDTVAPEETAVVQNTQETNVSQSEKQIPIAIPGLPPKPVSPVFARVTSSTVSVSATAMAPREQRTNGNSKKTEEKDNNRSRLPPGWEVKTSRKGETYYHNTIKGTTQWEHPLSKSSSRPQAESRENGSRLDKDNVGPIREVAPSGRSRSRERRYSRRSPSPKSLARRPRSRSIDSYRPARAPSPRREALRPSRDADLPSRKSTSRRSSPPSSRGRPPSPLARHSDIRGRSPSPVPRGLVDNYRRERRPDPLSSSSRHMSPSPRNRSQERSTFRQGPPARDRMDIDHYEPPGHAATRRRRLSDPQAISDSKRRRIDVPGPAPPGIDRYVPDHSKSSRMDLDAPIPRQDNRRSTGPDNQPSRERSFRGRSPPPPTQLKDRDRASDARREQAPSRLPPRPHSPSPNSRSRDVTPSSTASMTLRAKGPLPSQADAMRMRHLAPRDAENSRGTKFSNKEQAPTGPRADRGRSNPNERVGPPRNRSPPIPQGRVSRDERDPSRADSTYRGSSPRLAVDRERRWDDRPPEMINSTRSGYGPLGPPPRLDARGRVSGSNNIPVGPGRGKFEQKPPGGNDTHKPPESEQSTTRQTDNTQTNSKQEPSEPTKRVRVSRFGPPASISQSEIIESRTFAAEALLLPLHPYPSPQPAALPLKPQPEVIMASQQGEGILAGPLTEHSGDFPKVPVSSTILSTSPDDPSPLQSRASTRDGVRINRNRSGHPDMHQRNPPDRHIDAVPSSSAHLPYDISHNIDNRSAGQIRDATTASLIDTSEVEGHFESTYPVTKPVLVRQSSLLERLAPQTPEGYGVLGEEMHDDHLGEHGRGRRPKRSGRGGRR